MADKQDKLNLHIFEANLQLDSMLLEMEDLNMRKEKDAQVSTVYVISTECLCLCLYLLDDACGYVILVPVSACLSVSLSVCQSVCESVCLYLRLSVSQSVCLGVCVSVCLTNTH